MSNPSRLADLVLPPRLRAIHQADYPRFSEEEMARRRAAVAALLNEADADHLVYCGANRFGSAVQWLTGWPVTAEAVGIFTPGMADALFIQHVNHVPLARRIAAPAEVAWGGGSSIGAGIAALERRGARSGRVGVIGPMTFEQHDKLAARFGPTANLNPRYVRLRQVKSAEELDWLRIGAALTDRGMLALRDGLRPGLSERDLADIVERAYVAQGGVNAIHFFGVTPMAAPQLGAPAQFAGNRRVGPGDVVVAEISAAFWEHSGQMLRSFTVDSEPTPLYRDLHAVADAAFDAVATLLKAGVLPQQVVDATDVIEAAGFTIIDDLLHGYGGGYLPPILGSRSRPSAHVPDAPFRAGMVVVIQPNVVTLDGKAGVQTGEMVLITETGIEKIHDVPRGFVRV
ncbi:MAG TPA: M24 family metallopeptidase [Xanthobacteraceae bacterium]|jgi:Xaa-Pro dipeptidase|nr:M24 family metallopeptidase [Xanthobacteraceae bacterium]